MKAPNVTRLDKLRTVESLEELQGFVDQVRKDQTEFTREEAEEVARMKARFLKRGW